MKIYRSRKGWVPDLQRKPWPWMHSGIMGGINDLWPHQGSRLSKIYGKGLGLRVERWWRRRNEKEFATFGAIVRPIKKLVRKFSFALKDVNPETVRSRISELPRLELEIARCAFETSSCVYIAFLENQAFYVGQTTQLGTRLTTHRRGDAIARYLAIESGWRPTRKRQRCRTCKHVIYSTEKWKGGLSDEILDKLRFVILLAPGFSGADLLKFETMTMDVVEPKYGWKKKKSKLAPSRSSDT